LVSYLVNQFNNMDESNSPWEGVSSLLNLSGNQVPARARFAGQALISGSFGAVTFGLVAGQIGASLTPWGPILPFLVGSSAGFSFGAYSIWAARKTECLTFARHYPTLLAHALWVDRRIIVPANVLQASMRNTSPDEDEDDEPEESPAAATTTAVTMYRDAPTQPPIILEAWVQSYGLGHFSYCILAAMSCEKDVQEAEKQQRQQLIDSVGQQSLKDVTHNGGAVPRPYSHAYF
jgi:hypothetical protein